MTDHNHSERTPGCFRCEMTSDEIGVAMIDERVQYAMDYARTLPHYLPSDAEQALTVLADEAERTAAELDRLREGVRALIERITAEVEADGDCSNHQNDCGPCWKGETAERFRSLLGNDEGATDD